MLQHEFDLTTDDGSMPTWVMHPDGDGPWPVVLFLMDAPGMRPEIRDMAMRVATSGYYVLTSQLYYRVVREFDLFEDGPHGVAARRDRMYELMHGLSNAMVDRDAGALIAHAAADPKADAWRIGVTGYCMSGPFAISIAAAHPVRAAASFHGVALHTDRPDSPHLGLDRIDGEIYVAHAELDTHIDLDEIARFEAALAESSCEGRVEHFAGLDHGFTFPGRPMYDRIGSETHYERLLELFRRNL